MGPERLPQREAPLLRHSQARERRADCRISVPKRCRAGGIGGRDAASETLEVRVEVEALILHLALDEGRTFGYDRVDGVLRRGPWDGLVLHLEQDLEQTALRQRLDNEHAAGGGDHPQRLIQC